MSLLKVKPIRNKKYLRYVKGRACCNCGAPADDPHHIINVGEGGTGTKACDLLSMPLCRMCHSIIHDANHPDSKLMKALQWKWVAKTLQNAIKDDVLFKLE